MDSSSLPSHLTPLKVRCNPTDSDFDDSFHEMWHYNCVLSPVSSPRTLNSPAHTTSGRSGYFSGCENSSSKVSSPRTLNSPAPRANGRSRYFSEYENAHSKETLSPREPESLSSSKSTTPHSCDGLFRLFDQNNDGEVSVDEMMCLLRKLGIEVTSNSLVSLIESVDHTKDTALSFSEFTVLYESIFLSEELGNNTQEAETQQTDPEVGFEELLDVFNVYDKNKDGYISAEELAEVLRDLGFPEGSDLQKCQTLIDNVDTDGNGLVDLQEFKVMLWTGCGISTPPPQLSAETHLSRL